MRSILRLSANVLVISVRTLVNLLVKLTNTSKSATGFVSNSLANSTANSIANSRPIVPPDFILAEYDLDLRVGPKAHGTPGGEYTLERRGGVNIPLFPR